VAKLILMSMMIMTILIPVRHCNGPDPKSGLRRAIKEFGWFSLLYMLCLKFIVLRIFPTHNE